MHLIGVEIQAINDKTVHLLLEYSHHITNTGKQRKRDTPLPATGFISLNLKLRFSSSQLKYNAIFSLASMLKWFQIETQKMLFDFLVFEPYEAANGEQKLSRRDATFYIAVNFIILLHKTALHY